MPGFTHLQVAQPVTFGHHMLASLKCSGAMPSASPTAANAPTACHSAPLHWPARPTRSTANSSPNNSASMAFAKTRSMPFPTATPSTHRRCALLMMHVSRLPKNWWCRSARASASSRSPTASARLVDHAAEVDPDVPELARGRDRPRLSPTADEPFFDPDEVASPWPTTRTPGGPRNHCSTPSTPSPTRCASSPTWPAASPSTPTTCRPALTRASPPPPTSPTIWSRRACPSAIGAPSATR